MTREFAGKVVVVTGGSRGIGRGIAAAFAAEGAQTVLAASSEANLNAASDAIVHSGSPRPDICAADLRRDDGCKEVFDLVSERHGRCDILVNSAMHNFTKGLSGLGKRNGINVNAILPGLTETDRVGQLFRQRAQASGQSVDEERAAQIAKEGLVRLGKPEDIAALALFLCSE